MRMQLFKLNHVFTGAETPVSNVIHRLSKPDGSQQRLVTERRNDYRVIVRGKKKSVAKPKCALHRTLRVMGLP